MVTDGTDKTRQELDGQFAFFDSAARRYGLTHQAIAYVNAISASAAAILGLFAPVPAWVPGILAAVVAVLAIVDRVSHPQREWLRTRLTAEQLRSERTLYDAGADPYQDPATRQGVLAGRLNEIRGRELGEFLTAIESEARATAEKPKT